MKHNENYNLFCGAQDNVGSAERWLFHAIPPGVIYTMIAVLCCGTGYAVGVTDINEYAKLIVGLSLVAFCYAGISHINNLFSRIQGCREQLALARNKLNQINKDKIQ